VFKNKDLLLLRLLCGVKPKNVGGGGIENMGWGLGFCRLMENVGGSTER